MKIHIAAEREDYGQARVETVCGVRAPRAAIFNGEREDIQSISCRRCRVRLARDVKKTRNAERADRERRHEVGKALAADLHDMLQGWIGEFLASSNAEAKDFRGLRVEFVPTVHFNLRERLRVSFEFASYTETFDNMPACHPHCLKSALGDALQFRQIARVLGL